MTAQIHDSLQIEGQHFSIVGVNGNGLFDPGTLGVTLIPPMTSCWRGYICEYKVSDGRLLLDRLQLAIGTRFEPGQAPAPVPLTGPPINGVRPTLQKRGFNNIYENLNLEIPFTGSLQAGDGFIRELYVHMGFHPAWKYQTVLELSVEGGNVLAIRDISEQMQQVRDRMRHSGEGAAKQKFQ